MQNGLGIITHLKWRSQLDSQSEIKDSEKFEYVKPSLLVLGELRASIRGAASPGKVDVLGPGLCSPTGDGNETDPNDPSCF